MRQNIPEQLTRILGIEGISGAEAIDSRMLPYSTVTRLKIKNASGAALEFPRALFLKVSEAPESRAEVDFYLNPAQSMACPPLVRCIGATYDIEEAKSYILLEDLTETHGQPLRNSCPTVSQMRSAVRTLAQTHAAWWGRPEIDNGVGKLFDEDWLCDFIDSLERSVRTFVESADGLLSAEDKEAYALMVSSAERIWGRLTTADGLTVTQGDTHWWNFLYPKDAAKGSVRIFDWQLWHIDLGARDLAFLLALGGFAEPQPGIEISLLDEYHVELCLNGVANITREELFEDYRRSAIRNLNIPVIFMARGEPVTTWQPLLRRALDSFYRLRCRELIA